ncbi:hypothetical protein LEN26_013897 [Aphanomyces euteiches]|nr:hypothetical protein AeMF1_021526 [Aphanomyces euteiches]KAH9110020.1 hypothetical protein LEN26_013897 [Aphanomyces euteiches]KAH9197700.1 hypothetical protein AeNC1_000344 [Aphanomyces euteiches]
MSSTNEMQCKYAYKECSNVRTYKRDGQLHRLCEEHRKKANALQKVYATRRRREMRTLKRQILEDKLLNVQVDPVPFANIELGMDDNDVVDVADFDGLFDEDWDPMQRTSEIEGLTDAEYAFLREAL